MKALQQVSYNIKQKHQNARRNILYEDDSLDLVLDFCLGEGQPWRRLSSGQAKSKAKVVSGKLPGREAVGDDELDLILGSGCGRQPE